MRCKYISKCMFYNKSKMPMEKGFGAIFRKKYCESDFSVCARFLVAETLGQEYISDSLYPNMTDVAEKLIENQRNNRGNQGK